jgi:hypothetical protein
MTSWFGILNFLTILFIFLVKEKDRGKISNPQNNISSSSISKKLLEFFIIIITLPTPETQGNILYRKNLNIYHQPTLAR